MAKDSLPRFAGSSKRPSVRSLIYAIERLAEKYAAFVPLFIYARVGGPDPPERGLDADSVVTSTGGAASRATKTASEEPALAQLQRDCHEDPTETLSLLAAAYAELGRMDEARATVAKILRANPAVTLALLRETWGLRDDAHTERLIEALHKAGLPEGSRRWSGG